MTEVNGILRRGRGRFSDVDSLDAVMRIQVIRLADARDRKLGRRLRDRIEERQAVNVLIVEEFERFEEENPPVDPQKGFLARLVDWLADPANQEKLLAIIEFFMGLIGQFFPAPAAAVQNMASPTYDHAVPDMTVDEYLQLAKHHQQRCGEFIDAAFAKLNA